MNPWLTDKKPALYHQATVADLETDSQKLNSIQISARMLLKKSKASIAFFKAMLAFNNKNHKITPILFNFKAYLMLRLSLQQTSGPKSK